MVSASSTSPLSLPLSTTLLISDTISKMYVFDFFLILFNPHNHITTRHSPLCLSQPPPYYFQNRFPLLHLLIAITALSLTFYTSIHPPYPHHSLLITTSVAASLGHSCLQTPHPEYVYLNS